MKHIEIRHYCDGWLVKVDGKSFWWHDSQEDMGTESIKALLEYLGHEVVIEEGFQ
jgi:hypothetical protein